MQERRNASRKNIVFYMRVLDDDTQEILGHMVEVSPTGLRLETIAPLPLGKDYYLRVELTPDLGDRPYIVFIGRTIWCKTDDIQPNLFRCGFGIVEIMPDDKEIFLRILEKYAK